MFAGVKFSLSPRVKGLYRHIAMNNVNNTKTFTLSFSEKNKWNWALLALDLTPKGLLDPSECSKVKCTATKAKIIKGNIKCSIKNRVMVGSLIETLPQIKWISSVPITGTSENRLVITEAPQ